jgi:hypothetical protein
MKTLKKVLRINALSSAATGIGLVIFASTLATLFAVENSMIIMEVGIFLIAFAIMVFRESRRTNLHVKMIRLIVLLDSTWVVASLLIIVLQLFNLSVIGYLAIAAVALWVAAMAYLQQNGAKQITSAKL